MTKSKGLNEVQLDGRACIKCGKDNRPMVPVGELYGSQVFSCCEVPESPALKLDELDISDSGAVTVKMSFCFHLDDIEDIEPDRDIEELFALSVEPRILASFDLRS